MYRQLYGIGNLVEREKYGIGSKIRGALKSVAKAVIPKELDPVLKIAAPFLGPVYGPIASFAGSARSGKLDPFSLAAATLPYVQFGGAGATGLQSLIPTGYGGSGLLGQYLPGGSLQIGSGTSLSQLISDKAKEFLSSTSPTPITPNLTTPTQDYIGITTTPEGTNLAEAFETQARQTSPLGITKDVATTPEGIKLAQSYSNSFLDTVPTTQPGYLDLIKQAGSLDPNVSISQRFDAVKDLSTKAIQDLYTKPIRNAAGEIVDRELDKTMLVSTAVGAATYAEAIGLLEKAGVPEPEKALSEEEYQRLKVQPEKEKITSLLKPEAFGIRSLSAGGGLMNDPEGILSIKLTPAMAMGGRIDYETGGPTTPPKTLPMDLESLSQRFFKTNLDNLTYTQKQFLYEFKDENKNKKAKGGIMGSEIPVRQNQGGVTELDLRKKGGFIPIGIKEKADDVPAMLSRNEFVFTADAVRGAGKGSINKGAQKMYKLMKSLEKKVKKTEKKVKKTKKVA